MDPQTLYQALEAAADRFGAKPALHQPRSSGGARSVRTYSWNEYRQIAAEVALGLRHYGIRKGDIVGLYSETCAEFFLSDFGIFAGGSIAAAVYSSYTPSQTLAALQRAEAKALFVEDPATLRRLVAQDADMIPKPCFLLTGAAEGAVPLETLRSAGRQALDADPEAIRRLQEEIDPEDPAILYLTSGATGEPKMALVSHRALLANLAMVPKVLDFGPEDRSLAFLPSAHMAQRLVVEILPVAMGMQTWFVESLMRLPQEIREVRPTFFLAPPRLWERIHSTVCVEVNKRGKLGRNVFYAALGLGLKAAELRQGDRPVPLWMRSGLRLADRLVYRKIRERLGGKMRLAISGAAPLGRGLALFYEAVGVPLVEGYGLTEGGVVILNPLKRPKAGTIGVPLPDVEVKLGDDGELLIHSDTLFTGYWRDPQATAGVLRDGWLHTGDLATIDEQGYISITGRKKEVLVLSTGKKVYPAFVESLVMMDPIFSSVFLAGDRLPYVTALLTVNPAAVESVKGLERLRGRSMAEIVAAPPLLEEVKKAIGRVNSQLADWERIRRYHLLDREFSAEQGELTPTMKLRRSRVLQNHRDLIARLYAGKEESH